MLCETIAALISISDILSKKDRKPVAACVNTMRLADSPFIAGTSSLSTYEESQPDCSPDSARDKVLRTADQDIAKLGACLDPSQDADEPGSVRSPAPVPPRPLPIDLLRESDDIGGRWW